MSLVVLLSLTPSPSWAGPPASEPAPTAEQAAGEEAAELATTPALLGSSCSYSTGQLARRVLADGEHWQAQGRLAAHQPVEQGRVAAPMVLAEDGGLHVLATRVLQRLVDLDATGHRLALAGRTLDVDGTRYVVLTGFRVVEE